MPRSRPPDLAILYEHPTWFEPLFAMLDHFRIAWVPVRLSDSHSDPTGLPAPVILNRVAVSAFLREGTEILSRAHGLLTDWEAKGAKVLNGARTFAVDCSKARQLEIIAGLGLAAPETRVVGRGEDLLAAADTLSWPLLVKANVGGSGVGIARYRSREALRAAIADGTLPTSIDGILLVQDDVPPHGGTILRIELLAGRFYYGLAVEAGGDTFDLCPADACFDRPDRPALRMTEITPDKAVIDGARRIARAVGYDLCGIELMIDDRDGVPRFFDLNGLSNYVANPLDVLGWDPHERLIRFVRHEIAKVRRKNPSPRRGEDK